LNEAAGARGLQISATGRSAGKVSGPRCDGARPCMENVVDENGDIEVDALRNAQAMKDDERISDVVRPPKSKDSAVQPH